MAAAESLANGLMRAVESILLVVTDGSTRYSTNRMEVWYRADEFSSIWVVPQD